MTAYNCHLTLTLLEQLRFFYGLGILRCENLSSHHALVLILREVCSCVTFSDLHI